MPEPLTARTIDSVEEHWRIGLCDCPWHGEGLRLVAELRALAETVMRIRSQTGIDWSQLADSEAHARRVLGRENAKRKD